MALKPGSGKMSFVVVYSLKQEGMRFSGVKIFDLWLIGLMGICLHGSLSAQPPQLKFGRFTDENGLPDNFVRWAYQDRDGILWFGSSNGLIKYNGYSISKYSQGSKDSTALSGNFIHTAYEDRQGRLWVSAYGVGIDVSNTSKTAFRPVPLFEDSIAKKPINVTEIIQDTLGRIWLASSEGLIVLQESRGGFTRVDLKTLLKDTTGCAFPSRPGQLLLAPDGDVWIGAASGLFRYDLQSQSLHCPDQWNKLPAVAISDIGYDRKKRLWVSLLRNKHRLYYSTDAEHSFIELDQIPFDTLFRGGGFAFDLDNRLWMTVFGDQVYGYDLADSTLFLNAADNPDLDYERFFRDPYVDHSGQVWLPVDGFLTYPYPKGFHSFRHPLSLFQSIASVYFTDEAMWTGIREHGIVRRDVNTGQSELFTTSGTGKYKIPSDLVVDILRSSSGHMIMVAFDYVFITRTDGTVIKSFFIPGTNRCVFEDSKRRLWLGSVTGLHSFSEEKGILETYRLPALMGDARNFIQQVTEDKDGYLWLASGLKGLGRFNPETGELKQFSHVEGDLNSFPSIFSVDLYMDHGNTLWIGTDMGLVKMNPQTFEMKVFNEDHGLANAHISSILQDNQGQIWMSTLSGISCFDPVTEKFTNYSRADGLINISYYSRARYRSADGTIYFGGKNGIDFFKPGDLRKNPTAPMMYLASFNSVRKGKAQSHVHDPRPVRLSYLDDLIEIEFAGVHYSDQVNIRYEYRLEPLHEEWIDLGNERKVIFSNLKPGNYIFKARAMTPDLVWSESDLVIPIRVAPPFYQTALFRILAALLFGGLIFWYIRIRENRAQQKEKQEGEISRKIMELEKRALQAQMNPHFIYNSMNSIQQFILLHDTEGAMKYLTKFSRILRTVLNMSSQTRIPLYEEINLIEDYIELESMRFPNKFSYEIAVSPELNIHSVEIPPFFIQPQVENAIRHGLLQKETPGHLKVELNKVHEDILIIVEDNGIGREASRARKYKEVSAHESKGLSIIEERLKHLHTPNGHHPFKIIDLYDHQRKPQGTRVEILLPMDV